MLLSGFSVIAVTLAKRSNLFGGNSRAVNCAKADLRNLNTVPHQTPYEREVSFYGVLADGAHPILHAADQCRPLDVVIYLLPNASVLTRKEVPYCMESPSVSRFTPPFTRMKGVLSEANI